MKDLILIAVAFVAGGVVDRTVVSPVWNAIVGKGIAVENEIKALLAVIKATPVAPVVVVVPAAPVAVAPVAPAAPAAQ
jgi:hypothetical protein